MKISFNEVMKVVDMYKYLETLLSYDYKYKEIGLIHCFPCVHEFFISAC